MSGKAYLVSLQFFLIGLFLISGTGCSNQSDIDSNMMAYSWSPVQAEYSNILPFHWLKNADINDMQSFAAQVKTATETMPPGHRILFSWDLHRAMAYQTNGDFLYTADGDVAGCNSEQGFVPYRSLWWDKGVTKVRRKFDEFFKLYKQNNGELDVFVLDFEQGFSYWHLVDLVEKQYQCGIDHYFDALQNDSRFAQIAQTTEIDDLKSLNLWYENDDHLKWAAYTWEHLASYINNAVYEPLKKYFPDADFSNYGYYYQSPELELPDIHGHFKHRYTPGIHVGTHQSREVYGWMNLPGEFRLEKNYYPITPFNSFRFALNKLRAMLLSSEVPVSPWVAYKSFNKSHLRDNDYYQELIFHALLSGVDYLLYWNPSQQTDYSPDDDRLLNDLIGRVNKLFGNQTITFDVNELASWLDDMVITKAQRSDGIQLWRLSANLGAEESLIDKVVQNDPLKISIKNNVYEFDSMKIFQSDQPLSDKGVWLITK